MNISLGKIGPLGLIWIFVTTCEALCSSPGKMPGLNGNSAPRLHPKTGVEGVWATKCDPSSKTLVAVSYDGNIYRSAAAQFADTECKKTVLMWTSEGEFEIGKPISASEHTVEMDVRVNRVRLWPLTQDAVDHFKKLNYCGISLWKVGSPADVSHCKKDTSTLGKTCFSTIKIDGKSIVSAGKSKDRDCLTPARRFQNLDTDHPFYPSSLTIPK